MPYNPAPVRTRNAAATKQAILEAAKSRFAQEGYDGASLRDIASVAGVDAALVSRYFGSKEELFIAVLNLVRDPSDMFDGPHGEFGVRVASMLLDQPDDENDLDILLIMMRSASSPAATEPLRRMMRERFHDPFARWLGGPEADVRARLAGDMIMGVAIARAITDHDGLDADGKAALRERLARLLQAAVAP